MTRYRGCRCQIGTTLTRVLEDDDEEDEDEEELQKTSTVRKLGGKPKLTSKTVKKVTVMMYM